MTPPSPHSDAGFTRYPDVRGVPALRDALADYLTRLHARPVAEDRVSRSPPPAWPRWP